jgi:acyl carrier protein
MTSSEAKQVFAGALALVAPEIDLGTVEPAANFRDQVDIDSMDVVNLMIHIFEATGIDIPESDYAHFETLDQIIAYLVVRGT